MTVRYHVRIGVVTKPLVPGLVKTRIADRRSPTAAAALAREMLLSIFDSIDELRESCQDISVTDYLCSWQEMDDCGWLGRAALSLNPSSSLAENIVLAANCLSTVSQVGAEGPLDTRLAIWAGDCPFVTPLHLYRSLEMLDDHDVSVVPALDGGYCLLAFRTPEDLDGLMGVPHGDSQTLASLISTLTTRGRRVWKSPPVSDLDTLSDVRACIDLRVVQQFVAIRELLISLADEDRRIS